MTDLASIVESPCGDSELFHKDVTNPNIDAKKSGKAVFRRTIDYNASAINYLRERLWLNKCIDRPALQPDCLWSPKLCPPRSYINCPMNCVMSKLVRTSTNKNKCPIYCVCWTPEGRRLITGAFSGEFTLWNGLTFNFETILQAHESQIRCMKWSHNEEWLLTADHSGYVKYWQANMNNVEMYQAHKEPIRGVSFLLAWIPRFVHNTFQLSQHTPPNSAGVTNRNKISNFVCPPCFCPFDNKFVTCSDDSTVRIWDFHRCAEERVLRGHGSDVRSVAWHPVLSLIISGSKDAQQPIKLWDPKTGESVSTLYVHKNTCTDVAWNDNGNWFLTASRDHLIKLFDLRNLKSELQTFRGHKRDVMRVAWHPFHESLFASGSADGAIFYWLAGTETELGAVDNAHESMIWSLAWHPFGHILVSGANDFATKFWTRNRPGDVLKETMSSVASEGLNQVSGTTNLLGGALSFGELENTDSSFNIDLLKQLMEPSANVSRLDEEVAFSNNPADMYTTEIPGLNEGPVADLNVNDHGDSEDRDKNKLRSTRTIPKEFAANWESTRITAMPTVMMPTPSPSAVVAAAAAAAAVNNLNAAPQYLPPVKPLSIPKERSAGTNNLSREDEKESIETPPIKSDFEPLPAISNEYHKTNVDDDVSPFGQLDYTNISSHREPEQNIPQVPDLHIEPSKNDPSYGWSNRNQDLPDQHENLGPYKKPPIEIMNREPFERPPHPPPYHSQQHFTEPAPYHRHMEDQDYREYEKIDKPRRPHPHGDPYYNGRHIPLDDYNGPHQPRSMRNYSMNDPGHAGERGRNFPPPGEPHPYERGMDRYPPTRSSGYGDEGWSRSWSECDGGPDRFDYGPPPHPSRRPPPHREGRMPPPQNFHPDSRPPPNYPPPHKRSHATGPPPEHMAKYSRSEASRNRVPWSGHNRW